jgi:hypothetical protein
MAAGRLPSPTRRIVGVEMNGDSEDWVERLHDGHPAPRADRDRTSRAACCERLSMPFRAHRFRAAFPEERAQEGEKAWYFWRYKGYGGGGGGG